jgi:hypothetical protein
LFTAEIFSSFIPEHSINNDFSPVQ